MRISNPRIGVLGYFILGTAYLTCGILVVGGVLKPGVDILSRIGLILMGLIYAVAVRKFLPHQVGE